MAIFNTVYGGIPKWKPNANTVAYYKFDGDSLDYSGNGYNVTQVTSYDTLSSGKKVAYFSGTKSSPGNCNLGICDLFKVAQNITISFYVKPSSFGTEGVRPFIFSGSNSWNVVRVDLYSDKLNWGLGNGGYNYTTFNTSISTSEFQHIVLTYNHTNKEVSMYKNGTLVSTTSTTGYNLFGDGTQANIGYDHWYNSSEYLGEMIFEKGVIWTQEQATQYYNQTKANYS